MNMTVSQFQFFNSRGEFSQVCIYRRSCDGKYILYVYPELLANGAFAFDTGDRLGLPVLGSKGEPKAWVSLDTLVSFLADSCVDSERVRIDLGSYNRASDRGHL